MNYLEKILENERSRRVTLPSPPSMAIPHQAFSPREILAQFVRNDVQVLSHEPDDSVCVPEDYDGQEFVDQVQFFEDEFQARDTMLQIRDEIKLNKRKKNAKKQDKSNEKKEDQSQKLSAIDPAGTGSEVRKEPELVQESKRVQEAPPV